MKPATDLDHAAPEGKSGFSKIAADKCTVGGDDCAVAQVVLSVIPDPQTADAVRAGVLIECPTHIFIENRKNGVREVQTPPEGLDLKVMKVALCTFGKRGPAIEISREGVQSGGVVDQSAVGPDVKNLRDAERRVESSAHGGCRQIQGPGPRGATGPEAHLAAALADGQEIRLEEVDAEAAQRG